MNVKNILLSLLVSMSSFAMQADYMSLSSDKNAQRASEIRKEIVISFEAISKKVDQIPKGIKRVVIIGPTGSGKDTFLHYAASSPLRVSENPDDLSVNLTPTDPIPGTVMGAGASKTRVPTYTAINDIIFINCPGFYATEGDKQELINAFTIKKICTGDVKFLLTFKACTIDQYRGADELRRQFTDLVNTFDANVSNGSGCVLTQMNISGRGGYEDYMKKLKHFSTLWDGVTEGKRDFNPAYDKGGDMIKDFLKNSRFVPFPVPASDEGYYEDDYRDAIFNMIERIPEYLHLTEDNVRVHMPPASLLFAYEIARDIDKSVSVLIDTEICPGLLKVLDDIKVSCGDNIEELIDKLQQPRQLSEKFFRNADNISIKDIYEFLLNFLDREADSMKEFRGMMECISFAKQINPEFKFITTIWVARLSIIKDWATNTISEIERTEAKSKLDAVTKEAEQARKLAEATKNQADIDRAKSTADMLRIQTKFHKQMDDIRKKNVAERLQAKQEYEAMLTQRENAYRVQQQQMDKAHKKALEDMQTMMMLQGVISLEEINKAKAGMTADYQKQVDQSNRHMHIQIQQVKDKHNADLQRQAAAYQKQFDEANRNMQTQIQQVQDEHKAALQKQAVAHQQQLHALNRNMEIQIQQVKDKHNADLQKQAAQVEALYDKQLADANADRVAAERDRNAALSQIAAVGQKHTALQIQAARMQALYDKQLADANAARMAAERARIAAERDRNAAERGRNAVLSQMADAHQKHTAEMAAKEKYYSETHNVGTTKPEVCLLS